MPTHSPSRLWTALSLFVIASLACSFFGEPTPTPLPQPTATGPTVTPMPPIPPSVADYLPTRGDEMPVNGNITIYFDAPMDRASVEAAFAVEPKVAGTFEWQNDLTLVFKPQASFERAARYTVNIADTAKSQAGLALAHPFSFKAETVGFLEVTQVIPAPETAGAEANSVITILFNRPVVPLSALADQANLPNPLSLEPTVNGTGEWLNTSIYVFHPTQALLGGQTYTGRVKAGLGDTTGGVLKEDYEWQFSIQSPQVTFTDPPAFQTNVPLQRSYFVTFNQPMDRASTEAAFKLNAPNAPVIPGVFTWSDEDRALTFTPTERLALDTTYSWQIGTSARAVGGAALSAAFDTTLLTVKAPAIASTSPSDGAQNVDMYNGFRLYFTSPMNTDSIESNIEITPKPTQVYTYWSDGDFSFYMGWNLQPSTDYQVTVKPGMTDPYGNAIPEGRSLTFRTAAIQPQAYFNAKGNIATYNAGGTTTELFATTVNVDRLHFELYRLTPQTFLTQISLHRYDTYSPNATDQIRTWDEDVPEAINEQVLTRIKFQADGSALAPGAYYLRMSAPEIANTPEQYIVVSGANLTFKSSFKEALVWATDLNSGQPVGNLPITLYDQNMGVMAQGQTDAQGLFSVDNLPKRADLWSPIFAVSEGGPGANAFAVAASDWSAGVDGWDFGIAAEYYPQEYRVYAYTDRPLYRPGQVVYFKAIARHDDDTRYTIPDVGPVNVQIVNDRGEQVYSDTLSLSSFGTLAGEFKLADEASLGYYQLSFYNDTQSLYGGVSFSVAEYRKPEFQVNVTSPMTQVVQGDTILATVDASFFFGGAVSNADVHWSVLAADYVFNFTGSGYYEFYDYDYSSGESGPVYGAFGRLISEKDAKTDAQGRAVLEVKGDLSDKGISQLYTIEALVTDTNGQQVAARTEVIVHQGRFYIGVRPTEYVGFAGQPLAFNLTTVDWNSNPFPNQKVHVVYNDHQWNCALEKDPDTNQDAWACHVKDTPVAEGDVTTDANGLATISFTPPTGGTYQVKVTGQDDAGHSVTASSIVWVASEQFISWRQENNDRIQLVADRKDYRPGDTAEILIPSPFQGPALALVTIERGRILEKKVVTLDTNSTVYQLPITANYAPDVFFSVVIIKGVDENNPTPAFKMGQTQLKVSPEQRLLQVTLTPDKAKAGPRDTVTYKVKATDYSGQPVQAEFSIGVSDLAALSLAQPNSGKILDAFYSERGLGVRTALALTLDVERLNLAADKAKGGGGGAEAGFNEVRGNFLDTAYWNATVTTDANGEASVSVPLPDNLTTWRLDARGLTADTLVGQGTTDIIATKDLLIRPVTPRFFVVGDQAQLGAVVNNNTDQDIQATVTLAGTGVALKDSPATQNVLVKARDRVQVTWNVMASDAPTADLTFSVEGGGFKDASKPTLGLPPNQLLPIYKYSAPETVATAGQIDSETSVLEAINLPRRFDASQGELSVQLEPSLAASMSGGLQYLEHFPYECTEQTVSRFLPNVLTYQAFKQMNLTNPEMEQRLTELVSYGVQRLYARQHVDGGWGWWPTTESDPYISAYVVLGLLHAREAGFKVNQGTLDTGLAYLNMNVVKGSLASGKRAAPIAGGLLPVTSSANRQAFLLYVLAEAGQPDTSSTVILYEDRDQLSTYGRAYLAIALSRIDPNDSRIKTLLSDLQNTAILSATGAHWEEAENDWWNMNTDTRSTAIVLHALARLDPQNNLLPNVVRWLMVARKAEAWETTQETAWALIGLTNWMAASGELKGNYDYNVTLNGTGLATRRISAANLREATSLQVAVGDLLKDQANRLVIQRGAGDGRLYYTAHLNIYLPVPEVRALNRGLTVARQYTIISDTCGGTDQSACPPVTEVQAGQDVRVKVTLIAPNDLYYVVLEDPLPAGAEAVDTSLQTTSVVGEAPQLNSRDPFYYGWGWWWFSNSDLRDEKVVLFADYLPKGTYEYVYTIHASLPGIYQVIPTYASEFYFPEVFGRGDGTVFTIKP